METMQMLTGVFDNAVNACWDKLCDRFLSVPTPGPAAVEGDEESSPGASRPIGPGTDISLTNYTRFPAFDLHRLIADLYDLAAGFYCDKISNRTRYGADLNKISIDHLVSEQERADPTLMYAVSDLAPEIDFKRKYRLPFLDILDGTFPSPVSTPFEENNTVHVRHYRLRRKPGGGPTVVMINGLYVNDNTYFDWWCWRFAAMGLSSVLIDIPYHLRRVPKGFYGGQLLLSPNTDLSGLGLKQSFQDIQQLVNWLKAHGADKVGLFGISFGAWMAGTYVCHARNADFAIMAMPPMDAVNLLGKLNFGDELRAMEARGETSMLTHPMVPRVFNMVNMRPNLPNNKIFIAKGLYDQLVTPESIDRTAEAWGGLPWLRQYPTGHINTFVLNRRLNADVKRFIFAEVL